MSSLNSFDGQPAFGDFSETYFALDNFNFAEGEISLKGNMVGCLSSAAVSLANSGTHRVSVESLSACKSARQAAEPDLLKIPGVVGVAIGVSDSE